MTVTVVAVITAAATTTLSFRRTEQREKRN